MKKLLVTLITILLVSAVDAQDFSVWEHTGDYPLSQCYDVMEMSDGNFVVREAVFDGNLNDIGYILYKITPEGEAVDSLFIKSSYIYGLHPMLRDPSGANSNIMTSFYNEDVNGDVKKYYKATYFNDNLEITDEVVAEYPDSLNFPQRCMVDGNNDIVCRVGNSETSTYRFLRMSLDGEISAMSEERPSEYTVTHHSMIELSGEPLQYCYITGTQNSRTTIEVLDGDFNSVKKKTMLMSFGGWQGTVDPYLNAVKIDDGHFAMTVEVYKGYPTIKALSVVRMNSELEIESYYIWGEYSSGVTNGNYQNRFNNKNLIMTEKGICVVWDYNTKTDNVKKTALMVSCINYDMTLLYDKLVLSLPGNGMFANYGLTSREGGGVALSGWMIENLSGYYETKTIYSVIFDNETWSANEISAEDRQYLCYPNPTKDRLNISFSGDNNCRSVEIYSIDGRLVETFPETSPETSSHLTTIDISNLTTGIYMIKVRMTDGSEFTDRIVKQ